MFAKQPDELTVKEVSERLGVNDSRVRQIIRAGELKATKRGKSWYVKGDKLAEYIASRTQEN